MYWPLQRACRFLLSSLVRGVQYGNEWTPSARGTGMYCSCMLFETSTSTRPTVNLLLYSHDLLRCGRTAWYNTSPRLRTGTYDYSSWYGPPTTNRRSRSVRSTSAHDSGVRHPPVAQGYLEDVTGCEHHRHRPTRTVPVPRGGTPYPPPPAPSVRSEHPSSRRGVDHLSDTISCPIHFHDRFNCNVYNSTTERLNRKVSGLLDSSTCLLHYLKL